MAWPGFRKTSIAGGLATTVPTGIVFSRSGNCPTNTYLNTGTVISSSTGFPIRVIDGVLSFVSVQNQSINTFDIDVIEWDGTTETVLTTVSVSSARGDDYTPATEISLTYGNSMRLQVSSGSCNNPVVLVYIVGDVPV